MLRKTIQLFQSAFIWVALAMTQFTLAEEAQPSSGKTAEWLAPVITEYGKVQAYPDAAAQLNPARTYKVVFDVTNAAKDEEGVVPGLTGAARFINLAALAEVPAENLELVAVLHGPATAAALDDDAYQKRYQRKNPNRELISALSEAGVQVMVCGQALSHKHFATTEVSSDITIAVAALTVLAQYQNDGFALIPN